MEIISEWFDLYSDDLYHFLVHYIGKADVEDLVQDVFIKAIDHFDTFESKSKPKTWLFSIARNVAIDELRRQKRKDWKRLLQYSDYREHKMLDDPLKIHEEHEDVIELRKCISRLKPNYREVVILRGIKEFSVAETASILKWSENKVRVTYHRALQQIKQEKGGWFYEQPEG